MAPTQNTPFPKQQDPTALENSSLNLPLAWWGHQRFTIVHFQPSHRNHKNLLRPIVLGEMLPRETEKISPNKKEGCGHCVAMLRIHPRQMVPGRPSGKTPVINTAFWRWRNGIRIVGRNNPQVRDLRVLQNLNKV